MIKKAIILSAGRGKRLLPLTAERPKCLIPFSGLTLLEWQIAALAANGVSDIVVVTGYGADMVEAVLARRASADLRLRPLYNPFFEVADNIGSCFIARSEMGTESFALLNGDTLFEPALPALAMSQMVHPITVTTDRKDRYDSDDMKVRHVGDRLLAIGKTLDVDSVTGESIGMMLFTPDGGNRFSAALEQTLRKPEGLKMWYPGVINILAGSGGVGVAQIHGKSWGEVDFPRDLAGATQLTATLAATGLSAPRPHEDEAGIVAAV